MIGLADVKFLIVDGNHHMMDIVETILRGYGARNITRTSDAEAAYDHLRRKSVDIVITEFVLHRTNGAQLTSQIRRSRLRPDPLIPILMLTSDSSRPRIEAARDVGVTEVCCKPVTPREMFRKIVAIVDHPRAFVLGKDYIGPDRRRRTDAAYSGDERRDRVEAVSAFQPLCVTD